MDKFDKKLKPKIPTQIPSESQLTRRLSDLWNIEQTERDKAIKLVSKIFNKILATPSNAKLGDLNYHKIRTKFEKCRPGFYILYEAGFKQSTNGLRLQWTYNNENYALLKHTNDALQQKIKDPTAFTEDKKENDTSNEWVGTKYRKQVMARQKKQESEEAKKKRLIKEKIAMQKKEQKIEQQRFLKKIREQKQQRTEQATEYIKQQFAQGMQDMMQEMLKGLMPEQEQKQNGDGDGDEAEEEQGIQFVCI